MIRFCSLACERRGVVEPWSRGSVKEPPVRISVRPHRRILSSTGVRNAYMSLVSLFLDAAQILRFVMTTDSTTWINS